MSAWIAILAVGIVSFLFRFGPLVALTNITLPTTIDRALTYAGPSAMIAITVTTVVRQQQANDAVTSVGAVVALGVGGWLAMHKHSFLTAVAAGLSLYGAWLAGVALLTN